MDCENRPHLDEVPLYVKGPSWLSTYGCWMYSYLCNQCPFTTKVVSSNAIQHYVIKFVNDFGQVGGFLRILWFPPPRYNWNIVENGVNHNKPNWTMLHTVQDYNIICNNTVRPVICDWWLVFHSRTRGYDLHYCIISLKGKALVHKTSVIPLLIIEVPVPCPRSDIYRFRKYSDSLVFFSSLFIYSLTT